jgi:membrane associated rhomboid family serine protease
MKILSIFKPIHELEKLSQKDQRRIRRRCVWLSFRNWQTWIALVICGGCAALGCFMGEIYGAENIGTITGGATGGFIAGLIMVYVTKRNIREYLKSQDQMRHA